MLKITMGIKREDKEGRINQVLRNFKFFDAPAAIFCFVDKQMGPPQWSDLGMFLANVYASRHKKQGIRYLCPRSLGNES